MAKIKLKCDQCGGNIILDDSHEIGTCESCYAQFVIKQDQIIQKITQNITKHVYGYEGKDIGELIKDGYQLRRLGDSQKANAKFRKAISIEPGCWEAWLGYASTGGDRSGYIPMVPAYCKAYELASTEKQELDTYIDMTGYLPDSLLRSVFIRAYNIATNSQRYKIFDLVVGVIGRDESEVASLAIDLCPDDWRAYFVMGKFRQIRVRWCKMKGIFTKSLPDHAVEVFNYFMKAYRLAKAEGKSEQDTVVSYIDDMAGKEDYCVFANALKSAIKKEG